MAKGDFNGTIFTRCDEATTETLLKMQARYGTSPHEMARRLLKAACEFYRENNFFEFPVLIEPMARDHAAEDAPTHGLNEIGGNQTRSSEPDAEKKRSGKPLPPRK